MGEHAVRGGEAGVRAVPRPFTTSGIVTPEGSVGPGTPPAGTRPRPQGFRFRARRGRWATAAVGSALVAGCLLAVTDVSARAGIRANDATVASAGHRLAVVREELAGAEARLSGAEHRRASVTRSFDAAQSALSATEAALAADDAGIYSQGVDLGALTSCLGSVEEALNQLAVGQTAGGLTSLRDSSSSCAVLDDAT